MKKNITEIAKRVHYPRTLENLSTEDFYLSFTTNSLDGKRPLSWIELISTFNLLEIEIEQLKERGEEWERTIELYKQKCQATLIRFFCQDPKLAWEYYHKEYGDEMSLKEKEELYDEENNS